VQRLTVALFSDKILALHTETSAPVSKLLIFAGLLLWPMYYFPPGYPQPISFVFTLLFVVTAIKLVGGGPSPFRSLQIQLWLVFWCYSALVNSFYAMIHQEPLVLRYPAFYLQCLISVIVIKYFLDTETKALHIIYYGTVASLVLQILIYVSQGATEGGRQTLLFYNPNQLGFYALLALSILVYLQSKLRLSILIFLGAAFCGLLLVILSLSKAAIVSALVLMVMFSWHYGPNSQSGRLVKYGLLAVITVGGVYLYAQMSSEVDVLSMALDRVSRIGQSQDDSFQGRGYIRLWLYPGYMFFGAGEGLFGRFEYPREVHSLFGTVIFSYGLIGFTLLTAILVSTFSRAPKDFIIFFGPILLYSLTHHPLRQLMMWVFLVVIEHVSSRSSVGVTLARPDSTGP
jgi:hypothetical protein